MGKMKTVKQWINFLGSNSDFIFGLKMENGISCPRSHYYPKAEALMRFSGYLDEIVTEAFPMNFRDNGKIGALLIYRVNEEQKHNN